MSKAIGIDLGTTNTCLAHFRNKNVHLIEDNSGNVLIPSWVTFTGEEKTLVGLAALDISHQYPETSIFEIKRIIGQNPDNENVQADIKRFPYTIREENGLLKIEVKYTEDNKTVWDKTYMPETISGYILKHVREVAENRLQKNVNEAVITVPAYFGSDQREATKDAAYMAGFSKVQLLNEPTAAALAYQNVHKTKSTKTLLIYDFGGGTFDVSIVQVKNDFVKVLATDGDCHLGGTDIDMKIVNYITERLKDDYDITIERKHELCRLKSIAKLTKEHLSRHEHHSVELVRIHKNLAAYDMYITRSRLEFMVREIYERTLEVVERCLLSKNIHKNKIDSVVLVGGSTRIPMVQKMLENYFGPKKFSTAANPDHLVAQGAAIYAHSLNVDKSELKFEDVLSLSLGTRVQGDQMSIIIGRNTSLPCEGVKRYRTTMDEQEEMTIDVYQGERSLVSENNLLGIYTIGLSTVAPKGKVIVEIKYCVDNEGILIVEANELNTDNKIKLDIDMKKSKLSRDCLDRLIDEDGNYKKHDDNILEFNKYKIEFTTLRNMCEEASEKLGEDEQDDIFRKLEELDKDVDSLKLGDCDQIRNYITQVRDLVTSINKNTD